MGDTDRLIDLIEKKSRKIKEFVLTTDLRQSTVDKNLYIKLENQQKTGSFKIRGASSKLVEIQKKGITEIITASTGNHGFAVLTIAKQMNIDVRIYVPESINDIKKKQLIDNGAELIYVSGDSSQAEIEARRVAEDEQIPFISPYNDIDVIAGQGTIAEEIQQQINLNTVKNIYITIGGGGLISGIGTYIKTKYPHIEIIGCQPRNSAAMYHSHQAGRIIPVDHHETLSDGSAGGIEKESITFDICQNVVDRYILIDEAQIEESIYNAFVDHNQIIEGSAAVAFSAYFKDRNKIKEDTNLNNSIVIWCGGNIDHELWLSIINSQNNQ